MHTHHRSLFMNRRVSLRTARIGLLLLGFILLIDILAVRFSAEIQASLTLPVIKIKLAAPTHIAIPTREATATKLTVPTPTSALTLPVKAILAQDTFQRANQVSWGISTDRLAWGADAKSSQSFAIVNHTGQVTNGNGVYDAIIGPVAVNSEVMFSGSLTNYTSSSLGAVLRWKDANNLYKVFLGGGQLILLKKVAGVVTELKTVAFPVKDGASYTFRCRVVGQLLLAGVWPTGQVEPQTWMLTVTDKDLQSGYDGMRLVVQNGTTATITSFTETGL
ncbi:MAG TPA: hypothetical protein VFZ02_07780 [Ktedonobacteraceae bacterium]